MTIGRRGFFKQAASACLIGGSAYSVVVAEEANVAIKTPVTDGPDHWITRSHLGWIYTKKVYQSGIVVLDEKDFVPYRTIDDCEIFERKLYSDSGDVKDLPKLINFYEGLASNMETGEVKHITIGKSKSVNIVARS